MKPHPLSPVFVGRTTESARLADALARADSGEPQALLVGGEAGVGKSRLIEEFLSRARDAGVVTAVGGCVEIGAEGLPFAPVATVLRSLYRQLGGEALLAAAAGQEGELARLLPDLGEAAQEAHGGAGSARRLFELTSRLLERLTVDRPLVVVIEDLHWADRSTRELLDYLFRSLQHARLLLVGTYRSDDIHRRHPLRPFLAEADRLRQVRRVELGRFSRDEVAAQVAGILGEEPNASLVEEVYARSDGNAFFVEELACGITDGCLPCALSDSLRDLLLVRVERLPEDAQQVAAMVAGGGSTVEYPLLRAVAGMDEDRLIEALRAAVGASLLQVEEDGCYRFRHSLVREAVADDLLPGERSRLNRRFAQELEGDPTLVATDQRAARLASYWFHAHEPARALPAVLDASVAARRRYAYAEQVELLERAMDLWCRVPRPADPADPADRADRADPSASADPSHPSDAPERPTRRAFDHAGVYPARGGADGPLHYVDLLAEAVTAAHLSGRADRALVLARQALRELDERAEPLRAAWFLAQMSRYVQVLARGDGWSELGRAQELVRGLPPSAVHAEVLALAARWSMLHPSGPEGMATAERAVDLAQQVGAEETELQARITLGFYRSRSGDVEGGLAQMADVCERAVTCGRVGVVGRALVNYSGELEVVGRSAEAVRQFERTIEVIERFGLADVTNWAHAYLAHSLFRTGRWPEAERSALVARRHARDARPRAMALGLLAELALARGETEVARRAHQDAYRESPTNDPQPELTIELHRGALQLAAADGDLAAVRATVGRALDEGFPFSTHPGAWELLLAAATAESDARGLAGSAEGRTGVLRRLRRAAEDLPRPVPLWEVYALLVEAESARAEGSGSQGRWARAAALLDALDRPYLTARVRLRWAEELVGQGERERAGALLTAAHRTAGELGAGPLREAARRLAQRARLPLAEPGREAAEGERTAESAGAFRLTPRERDVLRLVAAGRSNRQIAEELFISPKTASVHVSNILAKLEVTGRGEASALAHRLRLVPDLPTVPPAG